MKIILISFFIITGLSVSAQKWVNNFDEAKALASSQDKQILLVFSGSDWCAPCIKLDKTIWQSKVFQDYAQQHYVLLRADFPRRKKNQLPEVQQKHNASLAERYNPNGYFPLVVLLDFKGKSLNKLGYKSIEPQAYLDEINAY